MEVVPNSTQPRRSNRLRTANQAKEDKDGNAAPTSAAGTPAPWSVREYGTTAWKKIASNLKGRSAQMVEDLYESNINYLSLPENAPQALVFHSILKDQYNREQMLADMEGEEEVAAVVLAESAQKDGIGIERPRSGSPRRSLSPRRKVTKQKSSSNPIVSTSKKLQVAGTPAAVVMTPERGKRATRKLVFTSPVSTRRKAATSPKQMPTKKQKIGAGQGRSVTPQSTRVLRARKTPADGTASNGASPMSASYELPLKLREKKYLKGQMGESPSTPLRKKKGTPTKKKDPASTVQDRTEVLKQLQTFLSSKAVLDWCMYEWFYPDIDKPFFDINDFQTCLTTTGLGHVTRLCRVEWGHVRSVFGKARRFSPAFLKEERKKLDDYRETIRQLRNGKSPIDRSSLQIPYVPPPLHLSTRVLAYHPQTRQLQLGTVIAIEHARYKVEFDNKDLGGAQWIPDTAVMAHEPTEWHPRSSNSTSPRTPMRFIQPLSPLVGLSQAQQAAVKQLYHLIKRLKQKEELIKTLQKMNEDVEKMAVHADFVSCPTEFQREYAKKIQNLAQVNEALGPLLVNLCNRTPQTSPGGSAAHTPVSSSSWPSGLFGSANAAAHKNSETPSITIQSPGTTSASNSPPSPTTFAAHAIPPPPPQIILAPTPPDENGASPMDTEPAPTPDPSSAHVSPPANVDSASNNSSG